MTSQHNDPEPPETTVGRKTRGRGWLRWIAAFGIIIVIALSAAFYWRIPLANAVLEFGLGRAGVHNARVTVTALSASQIRLADLRLGKAIEVKTVDAVIDLSRLPKNPVTRVTVDDVRADLTDAPRELAKMSPDWPERDGTDTAPPPTIRSLLTQMADLPDVTLRNISLKYGNANGIVTAKGSVWAAGTRDNAYGIRVGMDLAGKIDGITRAISINGTTSLSAESATIDLKVKANDGALAGAMEARADLSSDPAIFEATTRLETGDLATLADLMPGLETAAGDLKIDAATISPLAFGLDTPLGLPALTAALQKSGSDGIRFEAVLADASYGDRYRGINGTVTAALRRLTGAKDLLEADGSLSFRADKAGTADVSIRKATVTGAYRLRHMENALALYLPQGMRVAASQVSSEDGAVSLAPLNATLNVERAEIKGFGRGSPPQTDALLRLSLGATRLSFAGKPEKQHFSLAPLTVRLTGTVDEEGDLQARLQTPRLSVTEKARAAAIDGLDIAIRHANAVVTSKLSGRISAMENSEPLLLPTPLDAVLSLKRNMLTFNTKANLPGSSTATVTGRHNLSTGRGNAVLAVPAFRVTPGGGEFRALVPSFSNIDVQSGTVRATARMVWTAKDLNGTGAIAVDGLNFTESASGTTVQGLTADIQLASIVPPRTGAGQIVRVKSIEAGVTLSDLLLRFALIDGTAKTVPAVEIETFRTGFAGGHLGLAPTVIDSEAGAIQATVRVERVDLAALLSAVGLDNISGTGRLNGVLPVGTVGDAVSITGGRLAAAAPGTLRIRSEAAKRALSQGGAEVTLMLSALEDFRYESLTLDIEKEIAGQGRILLRTRGQNPAVRDGQPFVINLTLTGNVDGLAAVLAQALQLPGGLVRTMLAK